MAEQKWLVDGPKTIDIEGVRALKVGLAGGLVDIVAHDEPGIRIEVHSVSVKSLKISVEGDTVEIDQPRLGWDNWLDVISNIGTGGMKAEISILVPRDSHLKLGVVSAQVLVSGLHDDADISTVNGEVVVDSVVGDIHLKSISGALAVRNHHGKVRVHTVSGDVTASGQIRSFRCEGVSGKVFLDIAGIPNDINVNTVSGSVTTRLEPATPASYTISTISGKLQLDDSQVSGIRGTYTGKSGELDGAWLEFRVHTVSGDVSIVRSVPA